MISDTEATTPDAVRSLADATKLAGGDETDRRYDRQGRLDKIEYLIGIYRVRYMHYVWRDHMPEASEMERKIDRLLERWQRVRDRDIAQARS